MRIQIKGKSDFKRITTAIQDVLMGMGLSPDTPLHEVNLYITLKEKGTEQQEYEAKSGHFVFDAPPKEKKPKKKKPKPKLYVVQ